MKGSILQIAFGGAVLILGAGLEELLPKILGVGFPILLTAVPFLASGRGSFLTGLVLAVASGALEDSLSSLPPMTSVSWFLAIAVAGGRLGCPRTLAWFSYPCYQLWLALWSGIAGGEVFIRLLLSFPIGIVTAWIVGMVILKARREGAIDEQD